MKLYYNLVVGTYDKDPEDFFYCLEYPTIRGKCKNFDLNYLHSIIWKSTCKDFDHKGADGIKIPLKDPIGYAQKHYKNFHIKKLQKIVVDITQFYLLRFYREGSIVRHLKTENLYKILGYALNANNKSTSPIQVIYCKENEPNQIFVRSLAEMLEKIPEFNNFRFLSLEYEEMLEEIKKEREEYMKDPLEFDRLYGPKNY